MRAVCKWSCCIVIALMCTSLYAQAPNQKVGFHPTLEQCKSLAKNADDNLKLQKQPASTLNELDWKLSTCVAQYAPLQPTGIVLLLSAHGNVADAVRLRLEKAIGTLPPDEQAKVWASFNSDGGSAGNVSGSN